MATRTLSRRALRDQHDQAEPPEPDDTPDSEDDAGKPAKKPRAKKVAKPAKDKFDPKTFLAKVGAGKSISKLGKGQNVFVQGDVADGVFYIQKGKIKLGRF